MGPIRLTHPLLLLGPFPSHRLGVERLAAFWGLTTSNQIVVVFVNVVGVPHLLPHLLPRLLPRPPIRWILLRVRFYVCFGIFDQRDDPDNIVVFFLVVLPLLSLGSICRILWHFSCTVLSMNQPYALHPNHGHLRLESFLYPYKIMGKKKVKQK